MENVSFKHTAGGLKIPKVEENYFNVYAAEEVVIEPSKAEFVKTSTMYDVPKGYLLMVLPEPSPTKNVTVRFVNSVVFVRSGEKKELNILMENVTPLSIRKTVAPEYYLIDGTHIKNDYSKGYLPTNTVVVKKGDCICKAFLVKVEEFGLSRTTKKTQELPNEKEK